MDAKGAIRKAKAYVADVFAEEGAVNVGLEELRFDEAHGMWEVTVGFSRPWDNLSVSYLSMTTPARFRRTYKVVQLSDQDGSVLGMKNRMVETADA